MRSLLLELRVAPTRLCTYSMKLCKMERNLGELSLKHGFLLINMHYANLGRGSQRESCSRTITNWRYQNTGLRRSHGRTLFDDM
jgi:hypothetical protein